MLEYNYFFLKSKMVEINQNKTSEQLDRPDEV